MSKQFKQNILTNDKLMKLMLQAYKCGEWMGDKLSAEELMKKLDSFGSQTCEPTKEDLYACAIVDQIMKNELTNEINN